MKTPKFLISEMKNVEFYKQKLLLRVQSLTQQLPCVSSLYRQHICELHHLYACVFTCGCVCVKYVLN